jgi:hypothetical protein
MSFASHAAAAPAGQAVGTFLPALRIAIDEENQSRPESKQEMNP